MKMSSPEWNLRLMISHVEKNCNMKVEKVFVDSIHVAGLSAEEIETFLVLEIE